MDKLTEALLKHDPAFPTVIEHPNGAAFSFGMSRRDYFAAAALTGILASKKGGWDGPQDDAKKAYQYADAMLAAGKVGT